MSIVNTGNSSVDAIADMNISGNVTPINWYKTILRENGRPYLLAICILSEIVYWYRPVEVRDEMGGMCLGYRTKFMEDKLRKSYADMAAQFGESKRSIKAAVDRLACLGIIKREFRLVTLPNGMVANNIMYIDLCIEKLYEYTYTIPENITSADDGEPDSEKNDVTDSTDSCASHMTGEKDEVPDKAEEVNSILPSNVTEMPENPSKDASSAPSYKTLYHPPTEFCTTLPQNSVPPSHKTLYHPPTEFCRTNMAQSQILWDFGFRS